jgi:hypothetical protein
MPRSNSRGELLESAESRSAESRTQLSDSNFVAPEGSVSTYGGSESESEEESTEAPQTRSKAKPKPKAKKRKRVESEPEETEEEDDGFLEAKIAFEFLEEKLAGFSKGKDKKAWAVVKKFFKCAK